MNIIQPIIGNNIQNNTQNNNTIAINGQNINIVPKNATITITIDNPNCPKNLRKSFIFFKIFKFIC